MTMDQIRHSAKVSLATDLLQTELPNVPTPLLYGRKYPLPSKNHVAKCVELIEPFCLMKGWFPFRLRCDGQVSWLQVPNLRSLTLVWYVELVVLRRRAL